MKRIAFLLAIIAVSGCDISSYGKKHEGFSLFETSKGTVYLLNTTSGETKIIYSTESAPKLAVRGIYKSEDGKTYEYQGSGKLKEMTVQEAADRILEKYKN
jgi:hypothetical protein